MTNLLMTAAQPAVGVRWMIRRDYPEVTAIDSASFAQPWTDDSYAEHIRHRNVIGCVAEIGERIIGLMVFELHHDYLQVLRLAVHPGWRRRGVGTTMMQRLAKKLSTHRRTEIRANVPEASYTAQKFFQSCGFLATDCLRIEEAYRMVYFAEEAKSGST